MVLIGSHNAMSYLSSDKWYYKLLRPFSKCQDMSPFDLWDLPTLVRAFDIRLKFVDNTWYFAHGIVTYKEVTQEFWDYLLNFISEREEKLYLRIIFENCLENFIYINGLHDIENALISLYENSNHRIIPYGGYFRGNFGLGPLIDFPIDIKIKEVQHVSSIEGWGIFPRIWTKLHKKRLKQDFADSKMQYFVDESEEIEIHYYDFIWTIIY